MRIPEQTIDAIRDATDIIDLVSQYVPLKRHGQNYFGLCPFHQEKTPSFSVHPGKQIFRCFGCGEGGNVFTFMMKHENLSFVEALEILGRRANIPIPRVKDDTGYKKQTYYDLLEKAAEWFQQNLNHPQTGKKARAYLEKRGISGQIADQFRIGYAPDKWDGLLGKFPKAESMLKEVGLVLPRENKPGSYDRFRDRIIFPIRNDAGYIVAFGGRSVPGGKENTAKYINSPETALYRKGNILYGLWQAKQAIRDNGYAVCVEGYMDLIAVAEAGVENVVATLGTALTENQVRLLSRYGATVHLLYDSDEAGIRATVKSGDLFLAQGMEVRVILLEQGTDPDSYIRKNGVDAFHETLGKSLPLFEFWGEFYRHSNLLPNLEAKTQFVRSIVKVVARLEDSIKQDFLLGELSDTFGIERETLLREMKGSARKKRTSVQAEEPVKAGFKATHEAELLRLYLSHEEAQNYILTYLELDDFRDELPRRIFTVIRDMYENKILATPSALISRFDDEIMQKYIVWVTTEEHILSKDVNPDNPGEYYCTVAQQNLTTLKLRVLNEEIDKVKKHLRRMDEETTEYRDNFQQYNDLIRTREELKSKRS